ncbi:hypothetical protein BHU09_07700 [Tannerella sp. oral taxon 808]|nr:hypothetical protein BHU09_07700 [Tannerella sp. oral taxon 808]
MADFPVCDEAMIDKALEERMQIAQDISSMTLALRRKVNIKVRQPLRKLLVSAVDEHQRAAVEAVQDIILNEVNVKELKFADSGSNILVKKVKPDFKKLGPRYGKVMKALAAAIQAMTQEEIATFERDGSFTFSINSNACTVVTDDVEIISEDIPGWLVANEGRLTIALDITVTDELRREGLARELVNRLQNLRKSSGLEITDHIRVTLASAKEMDGVLGDYGDYIRRQVLADAITTTEHIAEMTELEFDDFRLPVKIEKV